MAMDLAHDGDSDAVEMAEVESFMAIVWIPNHDGSFTKPEFETFEDYHGYREYVEELTHFDVPHQTIYYNEGIPF